MRIPNRFLVLFAAALFAPFAQPIIAWAQVGIPRFVQNLTVRGDLAVNGDVDFSNADSLDFGSAAVPDASLSANVALYNANMSSFSTGTLGDARLSGNVPLLDATTNTFTGRLGIGYTPDIAFVVNTPSAGSTNFEIGHSDDDSAYIQVYDRVEMGSRALQFYATTLSYWDAAGASFVDFTPTSGTFSATWGSASCSSGADTVNYHWYKIGSLVTIVPDTQGTACSSSANSFSAGNVIPAALRPNQDIWFFTRGRDNGVAVNTCVKILTTGVMQANVSVNENCISNWTTSNSKGTQLMAMTYSVGDPTP